MPVRETRAKVVLNCCSCGNLVYRVVHFLVGGRMSIVELKIAMIALKMCSGMYSKYVD